MPTHQQSIPRLNPHLFARLGEISSPIYRYDAPQWSLFYTPGMLVRVAAAQAKAFEAQLCTNPAGASFPLLSDLRNLADHAERLYQQKMGAHFEPVSLNLYLNLKCNLECAYCFSALPQAEDQQLSVAAIQSAAKIVSANCARQRLPMTVVFHGGGEPVLSWKLIEDVQPFLQALAAEHGIRLFRYIATNGVMPAERARWLADSFELVGLSCDGPPEIQNAQRPLRGGSQESSRSVEETARILRKAGKPFHVRVTLTAKTASRQVEICRYICEHLQPSTIHVEPVYRNLRGNPDLYLTEDHLEGFVESFLEAQAAAKNYGAEWNMSGSRLHEIHGAHCNVFKQTLHLLPGNVATACFTLASPEQVKAVGLVIGQFNRETRTFELDEQQIRCLQSRYTRPSGCEGCLILHQCTHKCPNACPLLDVPDHQGTGDILCKLLNQVASRQLIRLGSELVISPDRPVAGVKIPLS